MITLRRVAFVILLAGGFISVVAVGTASAQRVLSGSEALRAERCTGDYVCDEDGSWAAADATSSAASAAEPTAKGAALCAARELVLTTLVEAHGTVPNAASVKLAEVAIPLMQARTACENGRSPEALAFYDRLIAELGTTIMAKDKISRVEGD